MPTVTWLTRWCLSVQYSYWLSPMIVSNNMSLSQCGATCIIDLSSAAFAREALAQLVCNGCGQHEARTRALCRSIIAGKRTGEEPVWELSLLPCNNCHVCSNAHCCCVQISVCVHVSRQVFSTLAVVSPLSRPLTCRAVITWRIAALRNIAPASCSSSCCICLCLLSVCVSWKVVSVCQLYVIIAVCITLHQVGCLLGRFLCPS